MRATLRSCWPRAVPGSARAPDRSRGGSCASVQLFGCHGSMVASSNRCGSLQDHDGSLGVLVCAADGRDATGCSPIDRAEIDHQDLIEAVVDEGMDCGGHVDSLSIGEVAAEHGVLQVIAEAS